MAFSCCPVSSFIYILTISIFNANSFDMFISILQIQLRNHFIITINPYVNSRIAIPTTPPAIRLPRIHPDMPEVRLSVVSW